jgi:hypothetical protein
MGVIMGSVLGMVFAFVKKDAKILVKILISGSIVGILHISINTATKIFDNSNDLFDILYLYQNFWLALVGFYIITAIWFGVYFHLVNVRGQPGLDEEISSPPSTS